MNALRHQARVGLRGGGALTLLCALSIGCGPVEPGSSDTTPSSSTSTPQATCEGPDVELADGRCQPPGLPLDMPCPPGEAPEPDGSCRPAGVPPSECGDGFTADERGGCQPVLPAEPCAPGWMAVPGDTECQPVSPCGSGKWGDIPVAASTQFVDGSYPGLDSDGSQDKPWTTLKDAVSAASAGAVVAIAAGTYTEDLMISPRPVLLWGVCPEQVTIQGVDPAGGAVVVFEDGTEIHGVRVTGPNVGIYAAKYKKLLVEDVWIDQTGLVALWGDKRSEVTLRRSLIERAESFGAASLGGVLTIEGSELRDITTGPDGVAIAVDAVLQNGYRAALSVTGSVLSRVDLAAVRSIESDITLDRVAVRSIGQDFPGTQEPRGGVLTALSTVNMTRTTIEGMPVGILLSGSQGTVEHSTFSGGEPIPPQYPIAKAGIYVQSDPLTLDPAHLDLRASKLAHLPEYGVAIDDGSAAITSTLFLDDVSKELEGAAIRGAWASYNVSHCALEGNRHTGILLEGGAAVVEATRISGVLPTTHAGNGITVRGYVQSEKVDASLVLRSSIVEDCYEAAIAAIEADLTIETSVLRKVAPRTTDGLFGDGIALLAADPQRGSAKIDGTLVEGAARAGIAAFGSRIAMGRSASQCASFPLAGESYEGVAFSFEKTADNACGCPEAADLCKISSPGLAPPSVE